METDVEYVSQIEFRGSDWFSSKSCGITGHIESDEEDPQLEETTITLTRTRIEKKNGKMYITYLVEKRNDTP